MSTDRKFAQDVADNVHVDGKMLAAFATGVTALTVPAYVTEVTVSVADDVSGVLTIAPRPAMSQLIVHVGDPGSGGFTVNYEGTTVLVADEDLNSFDCILVSTGSQMTVQLPFSALMNLISLMLGS